MFKSGYLALLLFAGAAMTCSGAVTYQFDYVPLIGPFQPCQVCH